MQEHDVRSVRRVILDTETTGGSARNGDRVCEVGMVETIDHIPTGRIFHEYIYPDRDIHWAATRVHGLTLKKLQGCPRFIDVGPAARDFIGEAPVLAHNAKFDSGFMNAEFERAGIERAPNWLCTVNMSQKAMPGGQHKLDVMVERLGIITPDRKIHGALLDAAILASVVARLSNAPEVDITSLVENGRVLGTSVPRPRTEKRVPRVASPTVSKSSSVETGAPLLSDAVRTQIEATNARPYSLDFSSYASLRSGRDVWSATGINTIIGGLDEETRSGDILQTVLTLPDSDRKSALRWIARGLDAGHALCMQVTQARSFERPMPESCISFAMNLATGDLDPEPGF